MKIGAISDIHGSLIDIEPCDVLCICGDILPLHIQKNKYKSIAWLAGPFQDWALDLPCKKIILIWGNHDFLGEELSEKYNEYGLTGDEQSDLLFQRDKDFKINIISDESYIYEGIKFYGISWCPSLRNWAFYGESDKLKEKYSMIEGDTDILLTHCPPKFGEQGVVLDTNNWNFLMDFGSEELYQVLKEKPFIKYCLSGHIHTGRHRVEEMGKIKCRNVSIKDENYDVSYPVFYFEINK